MFDARLAAGYRDLAAGLLAKADAEQDPPPTAAELRRAARWFRARSKDPQTPVDAALDDAACADRIDEQADALTATAAPAVPQPKE